MITQKEDCDPIEPVDFETPKSRNVNPRSVNFSMIEGGWNTSLASMVNTNTVLCETLHSLVQ